MIAFEKATKHNKNLQQRLEQLVAVHRQLLRKFAALELVNDELNNKMLLRDDRIKQLEENSKQLTVNLRDQSERHVAELTNLRGQINLIRSEHLHRTEAKSINAKDDEVSAKYPRTIRGGTSVTDKNDNNSSSKYKSIRGTVRK